MPFTDKDGHLTKAFQKENMTLKVFAKRIREQKLELLLIKSLSENSEKKKSVLYGSGCHRCSLIMPSLFLEAASIFVKVIQRKLLASFFPHTVYNNNTRHCEL